MAFKKIESKIGFAVLVLSSSLDKNLALKTLKQRNKVIERSKTEMILKRYYKFGIYTEGANSYFPQAV